MAISTKHIYRAKHILIMCLVLFALIPCMLKGAFLNTLSLDYAKPFNKSKTTTQLNSCQYYQDKSQQISSAEQKKINKKTNSLTISTGLYYITRSIKKYSKYSLDFSGNSPPKYILYKRLKLDVA